MGSATVGQCLNCSLRLTPLRPRLMLSEIPDNIMNILRVWISPTTLSTEGLLCHECFTLLQSALTSQGPLAPAVGHQSVCYVCGVSILRSRTHRVPLDCPQRNIILRGVPSHQVTRLERVCRACWMWATRTMKMQKTRDADQLEDSDTQDLSREQIEQDVFAESCADAGDSGPWDEVKVENTDIFDDEDNAVDDSDTLVGSNVCRVCLTLDVKMYDLKDIELRLMFQNVTGIVVTENNHSILERLCWECAGRLKAAAGFRNKALLSDALLQKLANTGEQIRKKDINSIKENSDYLKSGSMSVAELLCTVEIDPGNESVLPILENNDMEIVQNIVKNEPIELEESVFEDDYYQIDVKNADYFKSAGSLSVAEVCRTVEIESENESVPPLSENNDTEIVQNIVKNEPMELEESVFEDGYYPVDVKDELIIEDLIKTEIESDDICHNTDETSPVVENNIPFREDTINSAYTSSRVEPKKGISGYLLKTPSVCEDIIKSPLAKTTNRDAIPKIVSRKSTLVIRHNTLGDAKLKNINVKVGGIFKKTSNPKLVKKSQVKGSTDLECRGLEQK